MPFPPRTAIRLAPIALLAGCGGHPHIEAAPLGLAYLCSGEPLIIVYNDGGYIPGSTARHSETAVARSRAQLTFRGRQAELVADDAFTDLRYVGAEIVWTAQAETAQLEQPAAVGAQPERLECRRVRTVTPLAPVDAAAPRPAA